MRGSRIGWMWAFTVLAGGACDPGTAPKVSELRVPDLTLEARGDTVTLSARSEGVVIAAEWESLDSAVVVVSRSGLARAVGEGSARVRARFEGAEAEGRVTVLPPVDVRVSELAPVTDPNGGQGVRMRIRNLGGRGFYALELWKLDPDGMKRMIASSDEVEAGPGLDLLHASPAGGVLPDWVVVHSREPVSGEPVRTACVRIDGAAGCPSDLPDPPAVYTVVIAPGAAALAVGDSLRYQARAYDAGGSEIPGRAVAWSTPTPGVIQIDAEGTARAVASGYGEVHATIGGVTGVVAVTVTETVAAIEVHSVGILFTGETFRFIGRAVDGQGLPLDEVVVAWSSSHPHVVEAAADGTMLARSPGTAEITAAAGDEEVRIPVRVTDAPDAGMVVSSFPHVGAPELHVQTLGPGGERRLVHQGAGLRQPSASPDGSRIAFVMDTPDGGADLFVVNRDGTGLQRLTTNPGPDDQPAWSPDGQSIAFRSGVGGLLDVWVIEADGSGLRRLTGGGIRFGTVGAERPAWSPDGAWIAYAWGDRNVKPLSMSLRLVRRDGSETRVVTSAAGLEDTEPSFSPDGDRIVFRRNGNGLEHRIVIADLQGNLVDPGADLGSGRTPRWSPDGGWLLYVRPHFLTPGDSGPVVLRRIGWEVERESAAAIDLGWIPVP